MEINRNLMESLLMSSFHCYPIWVFWISQCWDPSSQDVNSLLGKWYWYNFSFNIVPFYNVSWYAAHGLESLSSILSYQQMAHHFDFPLKSNGSISVDRSGDQQPREDPWESILWSPFHRVYLLNVVSCSYSFKRVVPSVNMPVLLSKWRHLIIKYRPLWQLCLTNSECDLYPFVLVFSFVEFTEEVHYRCQSMLLVHRFQFAMLVLWEYGSTNPWFRLPIEIVVVSLCVSSGCTSYRCLQQVTDGSTTSYRDWGPKSWRLGPRLHHCHSHV
jgi:hypothetical protein